MKIILVFVSLSSLYVQAQAITLEEFLDRVEQYSNDIRLAEEGRKLAGAQKSGAVAGALPHLNAQAGYNRNLSDLYMYADMGSLSGDPNAGTSKLRINKDNEYSFNLVATQTLFNGTVFNAIKASNQYKRLTDYVYDASYQGVITGAKVAFYQALLLKKVWEVSRSSEQNAYENYLNVKTGFDNGLVSEFDLLQAEVRHRDAVPKVTESERNYKIALLSLKNMAGITSDEVIVLEGSLDDYPDMPESSGVKTILKQRPDYNALLWEERLRKTNVNAQKSNYLPSLTGSFTYAFSSQSDEWSFDDKNDAYILGLNLSIPIFNGGAIRAGVQQAKIELDKTKISISQAEDDIEEQVTGTRLKLEEAFGRIESAESTLRAAEKAFGIAEATSQAGLATQLELKDSRVVLDQATVGYYSAVFDYLVACFEWDYIAGSVSKY